MSMFRTVVRAWWFVMAAVRIIREQMRKLEYNARHWEIGVVVMIGVFSTIPDC